MDDFISDYRLRLLRRLNVKRWRGCNAGGISGGSAAQMKWGWRKSSDTAERALRDLCVSFGWAGGQEGRSDAAVWINSQAAHIYERLGR